MANTINYRPVVTLAYKQILGRDPDPGGLESWNSALNSGTTEASMREAMLRSDEYRTRFQEAAPPPPPPPPPVDGGMALRVEGNKFVDGSGKVVNLLGAISCCADPDPDAPGAIEFGWPLVGPNFIDLLAVHHLNYVHARLGPMINKNVDPNGEPLNDVQAYALAPSGKQYDLDKWNDEYWAKLRGQIAYAFSKGIYYQVDIADTWVMQHRVSPWNGAYNIQGWEGADLAVMRSAPTPRHEQWIRKVIRETATFPNVIYQDGNESFKAASRAWVFAMRDIVRDEQRVMGVKTPRPFGTNSQNEEIERGCDYGVWHERDVPAVSSMPRMTNEFDDLPPASVLDRILTAWATGGAVSFQYWRGGHTGAEFRTMLATLTKIVEGTYVPPAIPDVCDPLVRWSSRRYNTMDAAFQPTTAPVRGGYVVVDSTERFGSGRGVPCNDEHPENCGGRKCEDPRGGLWTLEDGTPDKPLHLQSNDFQCRVGPMRPGHYKLRVRPRPDLVDHYGKPVPLAPGAAEGTVVEWDVP